MHGTAASQADAAAGATTAPAAATTGARLAAAVRAFFAHFNISNPLVGLV